MFNLKRNLLFALLLLFAGKLFATHIVGGGMTYECLGPSGNGILYRFTMKVYLDCFNGTTSFDNPAHIAIYSGTEQSNTRIATFNVNLASQQNISITQPDCIDNLPSICLKEGIYTWERVLPQSAQSYFVVYQRCCRTNAITNIINPQATGATYSVEITPAAQLGLNNSPVFNTFPPVVICNNYPLEVDYSVTDQDGDQLVYSFCAPYSGGSPNGNGCNNPAPNPPCGPEFDEVVFASPAYSAGAPMGGNPVVQINAQTGVISGTPLLNGQYVVGVCVEEYRNGQLLSVTRRDFQFNVAPCAPQVTALVAYDEIAGPKQYIIRKCDGSTNVTITNESLSAANAPFQWTFDLNGSTLQNNTDYNLSVNFPGFGVYNGTLVLNAGLDCGDTAFISVELYPPASLNLGPDIVLCKDSTVVLDAGTGFTSYHWQDGSTAQTLNATASGIYYVTTNDACGKEFRDSVRYILKPIIDPLLSDQSICPGGSVTFNVYGFTQYLWSPAAGLSCTNCGQVTAQPTISTDYQLVIKNDIGCTFQTNLLVTVLPTPKVTRVIKFFSNQSVTLGGQTYTQPGTVVLNVPSTTGGCDSLNTYMLELLPTTLTLQCPSNLTVALPNNGVSAVVNYALPVSTTNCPGTQPAVQLQQGLASGGNFPAGVNTVCYTSSNTCGDIASCCFTVTVTTLDIQCPISQTVQLPVAATTIPVSYLAPSTTSTCPGAAATITLLQGLPSGGAFPLGLKKVCYEAKNACGNRDTCCFNIRVLNAPDACDIKNLGCMQYELLDIRLDSIKQPRFRISASNFCTSEVDYIAIELPPGIVAVTPENGTIYKAPNTGNQYLIRNPNGSPFYSTRYRSMGTGIANGEADVLEHRLPQQSLPNNYIHITGKLKNGQAFEAYLNTFNCPIQPWAGSKEESDSEPLEERNQTHNFAIRPNPTDGLLFVDLSQWKNQSVQIQVLNAQGQLVVNRGIEVGDEWLEMNLNPVLANGLYYLVVQPVGGAKVATRFVLER
jgi:HYR domain